MMYYLKLLEIAFNHAIDCYYLKDIQEFYDLSDEEIFSLIKSNYSNKKVKDLIGG